MNWEIQRSNSPEARKLWQSLESAAECSPEWMRQQVTTVVSGRVQKKHEKDLNETKEDLPKGTQNVES